jgi:predicted DNA-binding transcriptional regulator AlpA
MSEPSLLMNVPEVAALLGLSKGQLQRRETRLRLQGFGFPAPHIGRPLLWSRPMLERWLEQREAATSSPIDEAALWRKRLEEERLEEQPT